MFNYNRFGKYGNLLEKLEPKLRKWANLTGEPKYLGGGTQGKAFRYGDKTLKITNDQLEVNTCAHLKSLGNKHPNIYKIYNVGKFNLNIDPLVNTGDGYIYFVVYEYLNKPTEEMKEVVNEYHADLNWDFVPSEIRSDKKFLDNIYKNATNDLGEKYAKYAVQAFSAAKYLWDNGITSKKGKIWNDWGENNIASRGDDLVLIDVGYSLSPKGEVETLEEIIRRVIKQEVI